MEGTFLGAELSYQPDVDTKQVVPLRPVVTVLFVFCWCPVTTGSVIFSLILVPLS